VSPVLIARETRSKSSKRLAIPFDMHRIFIEEGYDFIEDIVWEKPEGVGWSFGRGRRFSADRNPLQYKPLSITEYILVYRKHTDKLIDWNLKQYDKETLEASKIPDDYEKTNVWRIQPANSPKHPAVFPLVLAENIIRYYSFVGDVVLDPFAGIGTVGIAAQRLDRKFILIEKESKYCKHIFNSLNCLDFD
jgi:DNA modification methylase